MEQYLKESLDLLEKVNNDLVCKLSREEFELSREALKKIEISKKRLEKILKQSVLVNLEDRKAVMRLINRFRGVYRDLWKSVYKIYTLNIKIMDENNFGKNS